jgi:hypothetical protein
MTDGADDKIVGKVAEIVSDRELILNRGSDHGVEKGMYFNVLDTATDSIKDPETGEVLGGFKRIKISVVAVEVAEKITLAQTFRSKTVNLGGQGGLGSMVNIFAEPRIVERVETLKLDPTAAKPLGASESAVAVGDPFEQGVASDGDSARAVTLWK